MEFSSTANKNGIIQSFERKINMGDAYISGDATRLLEATAIINQINSGVWHLIFMSSGNWIYDDSNQTNLPQASDSLISGTAKHSLPTDALTVKRIEIKDEAGGLTVIRQLAEHDIEIAIDEFRKADGIPEFYRLIGRTIELFPAPNYNSTGGLKVYFDRASLDFASTDTTKPAGFASPYHEILPTGGAIEWLKIKNPLSQNLAIYIQDYQKLEKSIIDFYQVRNKDYKPRLTRATEIYK